MEYLLSCLAALAILAVPVALLVFLVRLHRRIQRLDEHFHRLDERLARLEQVPGEAVAMDLSSSVPAALEVRAPAPESSIPKPDQPEPVDAGPVDAGPVDAAPISPAPPSKPVPQDVGTPWWHGLEEKIAGRAPIWLGAAALALAVAYLVKISIDSGLLTPLVRVTLGVFTGIGLLVGGETLRRPSRDVARGMSAAGVAALYSAFFAATQLYALVSPWVGFGLMALTTATAVALSLRQGVIVAAIGLVGGFLTPALVSGQESSPPLLFAYLLLLQAGLVVVTLRRAWWKLGVLTLAGGLAWALLFLTGPFHPADAVWVGLFLLGSVATFLVSILLGGAEGSAWGSASIAVGIGWGAMGGGLAILAMLTASAGFGALEWAFFGLLAVGCLALARLRESFHGLAWLGAFASHGLLGLWLGELDSTLTPRFFVTTGALSALFVVGSYLAHHRSEHAGSWAALTATSGMAGFLLAERHGHLAGIETFHWGYLALALGALYIAAAIPVARRRTDGGALPLAALAVGATAFLALAVPLELERQWLTVAWALETLALVALAERLAVPVLRKPAWVLLTLVGVRLLLNDEVLDYPIGTTPLFNWLLYGYGLPIAAFALAVRPARRQGAQRLGDALAWVAQALGVALACLEIRHYFHAPELRSGAVGLVELGTQTLAGLALALLYLEFGRRLGERPLVLGGKVLCILTTMYGALLLGLADNPLWSHHAVGETWIFNRLVWVYGLPMLLLIVLGRRLVMQGARRLGLAVSVAALGTAFLFVTLEVRQAFRGDFLDTGAPSNAENYAYSSAWIVLGTLLFLGGILRRVAALRYAGLAVMTVAVCKVFLYDTAQLEGLLRVLSLVALGGSLFLLAHLYRRFVLPSGGGRGEIPDPPSSSV